MPTIKDAIVTIAKTAGYEGAEPQTIADAIDALTDTLAGSDVDSGKTIAEAIGVLAPYIGSGGGGGETGNRCTINVATDLTDLGYDSEYGYFSNIGRTGNYSVTVDLTCTTALKDLTFGDGVLYSENNSIFHDGKKAYVLTGGEFYPSVATAPGDYDISALLITPTTVVFDDYGSPSITAYTSASYSGVRYHYPTSEEFSAGDAYYYTVPLSDIPASVASVDAAPVLRQDGSLDTECMSVMPMIVIQGEYY